MQMLRSFGIGVALAAVAVVCAAQEQNAEAIAKAVIAQMAARQFDQVVARSTEAFAAAATPERLAKAWDASIARAGAYRGVTVTGVEDAEETPTAPKGTRIVRMTVQFGQAPFDNSMVAIDPNGRVAAMHLGEKPKAIAGVEPDRMGVYRALADMIVERVKSSDLAGAAKLSRILEISWDRGESALKAKVKDTWTRVDEAMDAFVLPIIEHQKSRPDATKVDAAYRLYLDALKQADVR